MSLPVVVVSSASGPRAESALRQLASGADATRMVALVPGSAAPPADDAGMRVVPTVNEPLVLGQGCSCCTVRGDLLGKIRGLAGRDDVDRVLVHAPLGDDLTVLAKTFTVADQTGSTLGETARFDGLVVVVGVDELASPGSGEGARALVRRIELATVVLLDTTDARDADRQRAARIVAALNPGARVLTTDDDTVPVGADAGDAPFDLATAQARGELEDVIGSVEPEERDGVVRFSFHGRFPFHPGRLHAWLSTGTKGLVRARGSFWVATAPNVAAELDIALGHGHTEMVGHWWAAYPEEHRPDSPEFATYIRQVWHPTFGDRRHELGFVGVGVDPDSVTAALRDCVLTKDEMQSRTTLAALKHPFAWPTPESR